MMLLLTVPGVIMLMCDVVTKGARCHDVDV